METKNNPEPIYYERIDMGKESNFVRISKEGVYVVTGTNLQHGITVSAKTNATIVLRDANLCDPGNMGVAFHIAEDCYITVVLEGKNILQSGREMAAIQTRQNSVLTIKGDGTLIAYGGEGAAGIGCGYATECGDIIIEGGTIEAYAGYQHETSWRAGSAGIGGAGQYAGRKSKCGNITITGGKVTAKHDKGIWDIGPGDAGTCGTVQVNEGTITPGVRVYDSASASEPVPAPEVTPSSNIRKIVQIRPNIPWQNSGIRVKKGQRVHIDYMVGRWTFSRESRPCTTEGDPRMIAKPGYTYPGGYEGELIGRIGNSMFRVGTQWNGVAACDGDLEFCINDDLEGRYGAGLSDNLGVVAMEVRV